MFPNWQYALAPFKQKKLPSETVSKSGRHKADLAGKSERKKSWSHGSKQREIYFVVHLNLSKLANQAKPREDAFPIRIY